MDSNIIKSMIVILLFLGLMSISVWFIIRCIKYYRSNEMIKSDIIKAVISTIISVVVIGYFGEYAYPFEIELDPILIAEYEIPEIYKFDEKIVLSWRGVYEEEGFLPSSLYFVNGEKTSKFGFDWPEMDLDNHSYIITYGYKIKKLSYNVWEIIDKPFFTGIKAGKMVYEEEFDSQRVYVYEIPKMHIDNDVNRTTKYGLNEFR